MKTISSKHQRRTAALLPFGFLSRTALLGSVLLLAAASLTAMPSVTTISGGPTAGYRDGDTLQTALFHNPVALALDKTDHLLFVADRDNNAIRQLDLSANQTISFATYGISHPVGVAVDDGGNVFVLNNGNGNDGTVVEFDVFGDFLGVLASGLANAQGLAMDSQGNLYVTVQFNTVLQITPGGVQNVIATIPAANTFLRGITVMDNGFLAVCDFNNNGIYTVDPSSGDVTVLTGFNGAGDHFGTKAFVKFNQPYGVSAAGNGFLVVTDYGNNRVKVVDVVGTVTNLYGVNSSFWVTGPGTVPGWFDGTVCRGDINYNALGCVESRLPAGIVFADDGTVYTSEDFYHLIRKVTASGLPLHPAPLPPVPAPEIGWVDFTLPPAVVVSILRTAQPFVFNNDVKIEIQGTAGTETHYTAGPTPFGVDTIPDPSATVGSTPPSYHDSMFPDQVPQSLVSPQPDITVKAIGVQSGRPSSLVVSARFQFKVANPSISGDNAALFTLTDETIGAEMWYTRDGSDPVQGAPSEGPILTGTTLSINADSALLFKVRAFRKNYQDSDIVSKTFSPDSFVPNSLSFGFASGEASSDFIASPGQFFYAPVTLSIVPGTKMYSLQFNIVVTNAGPNPGPPVAAGAYGFASMLEKPVPGSNPVIYETILPLMFSAYASNPPPPSAITYVDGKPFVDLTFIDAANNLEGVGWLERLTQTNLYDTTTQDLIKYSQPHDTLFDETGGRVVLGGYAFQVPPTATPGQTYQIQIGRPSATSDGIGTPGSAVFITTLTNGSLTAGSQNAIKIVTAGQRKYIAGDSAPFRWFNAGDFGNTNLDNSDVMQVFQTAIYHFNSPPFGSDFFDSMDSCGGAFVQSPNGYLQRAGTIADPATLSLLFDGNDTTINQIAFGDGNLDVCDVYVTFRRSLDPSLTWFQRFWTNGIRAAQFVGNPPAPQGVHPLGLQTPIAAAPAVSFAAGTFRASAGQTLQIPITAQIQGNYPLRVLMLNLSVNPLDGSPALTVPVQFSANPALGQSTLGSSIGNGNYGACWLNSSISGLTSNAVLGTLTVTIPANATSLSSYAIHFDHASASPNGLGSFANTTTTGLITLADRSASSFNDGIPDAWRLQYFGSIYNLLSQATADADGDGASNWHEYVAGTDPTDPKSFLQVSTHQAAALLSQDCVVHWPSVAGKSYVIERSATLFAPNWIPVSTNNGTGTDMEFHDTTGGTVRFYRVQVAP